MPEQSGQDVEQEKLLSWCLGVQQLAAEEGREAIADQLIGQLLAHAPMNADNQAWPHEAVCNVIEMLSNTDVERGIVVERVNVRGVYSKAPDEGGDQERKLARQTREWAEKATPYVRTSAMLFGLAQSWDSHAEQADTWAAQRALRW
ncbi:hypothetical protein D3C76_914420 [compost metagenome]